MKVLVLGSTGMLGHELLRVLHGEFDVVGTVRGHPDDARRLSPVLGDLPLFGGIVAEQFDSVLRVVADTRPDAVVNCVGIVKQLAAAKDAIPSITVNALFPHRLAVACRAAGARLVHVSTDCVFSGRKGRPYTEEDVPDPVDLYGRSKLLGEVSGPGCLTLRTSIVGRELRNHTGLLEWFLGCRGETVRGFANALYTGLTTTVLSRLIGDLLRDHPDFEGVWQVASRPITKYDLLGLLNESFEVGAAIEREPNFRCDRRLDGSRFRSAVGFVAPTWPEMIHELREFSEEETR